jgi:hypothetical protein
MLLVHFMNHGIDVSTKRCDWLFASFQDESFMYLLVPLG